VAYLIKRGIDPARITVYAYGEDHPEAKGHPAAWKSNRWVDIVITVAQPSMKQGIRH
jgi:outer membrane protein OmpA-like peptidoglycan-associated protein